MNVIFLMDMTENEVDGVIIAETTTSEEIESCIQKVKSEHDGEWTTDDIAENLPCDCEMYLRSSNEAVWY